MMSTIRPAKPSTAVSSNSLDIVDGARAELGGDPPDTQPLRRRSAMVIGSSSGTGDDHADGGDMDDAYRIDVCLFDFDDANR